MRPHVACWLAGLLLCLPIVVSGQVDPGFGRLRVVQILDIFGQYLGVVVVVGASGRGFEADHEYWRFDARALASLAEHDALSFVVSDGDWGDPWIAEALEWQPVGGEVAWRHPTKVAWQSSAEAPAPEVEGGTYFGHPTLGGLTVQYTPDGQASLTWFKLTDGAFMQLEYGAVFERQDRPPADGSWWQGVIDPRW